MATKKIKKAETPIDKRETFMSIRKDFAGSGLSVEEKLRTLYELQKADSSIDKIIQLRGELPSEVEALEGEVASLKGKAAAMSELLEGYTKSIANNRQNIVDADDAIAKYRKQLENVTNSREFDSLNKEIENQDLLHQIAEKHIREAKELIEEKSRDLKDLKDYIAVRDEDLAAKKEELAGIVERTATQEKKLHAERETCAAKIDARTMSAYERIRASVQNHLAVVKVYNGDSCGGCFTTIIPQTLIDISSNKTLIICEHCGRIVVSPDIDRQQN